MNSKIEEDAEVLITRSFDAPRELVWQAWTELAHLKEWHAPTGCEIHFERFDFREGGSFLSCIRNPAFGECWCLGEYLEVKAPERLVYRMAMANAAGERVSSAAAGHISEWPDETVVTLTLEEVEGKTVLTLQQTVSEALAKKTGAYPSWLDMLERLGERLEGNGVRKAGGV
jgi:YD repeat-containing protein